MASINSYDVGDLVRVTGTLTDSASDEVDPTAITITVKEPDGTETDYVYGVDVEVVKSATGIYYMDVSATDAGYWWYRVQSTGTGQASGENSFHVKTSRFA